MSDELACTIYVETDLAPDALARLLAGSLSGSVRGVATASTVTVPHAEIDVRRNPDGDSARALSFPDGFLAFRYALELYPAGDTSRNDRIALAGRLLELLWSNQLPAVAACDFEEELPLAGGYKKPTVPWPHAADRTPSRQRTGAV